MGVKDIQAEKIFLLVIRSLLKHSGYDILRHRSKCFYGLIILDKLLQCHVFVIFCLCLLNNIWVRFSMAFVYITRINRQFS